MHVHSRMENCDHISSRMNSQGRNWTSDLLFRGWPLHHSTIVALPVIHCREVGGFCAWDGITAIKKPKLSGQRGERRAAGGHQKTAWTDRWTFGVVFESWQKLNSSFRRLMDGKLHGPGVQRLLCCPYTCRWSRIFSLRRHTSVIRSSACGERHQQLLCVVVMVTWDNSAREKC